jgi:hypothetical protein
MWRAKILWVWNGKRNYFQHCVCTRLTYLSVDVNYVCKFLLKKKKSSSDCNSVNDWCRVYPIFYCDNVQNYQFFLYSVTILFHCSVFFVYCKDAQERVWSEWEGVPMLMARFDDSPSFSFRSLSIVLIYLSLVSLLSLFYIYVCYVWSWDTTRDVRWHNTPSCRRA